MGTIDIYGNRHTDTTEILKAISVKAGDTLNQTTFINRRIEKDIVEKLPEVKHAMATMTCCDGNGNYHLFIGIAENDSAVLRFRPPPVLKIRLPDRYTNAYQQFSEKMGDAIVEGQAEEDWSQGHSLSRYAPARKIQEKFMGWADAEYMYLAKVLRESAYEEERATAAQIIAYSPDKAKVVGDLVHALSDVSDVVRNHSTRALAVIGYYAADHPEQNIKIPYQPFIRLVNSFVWSDRNKGISVLLQLSRARDEKLFHQLKTQALPAITEMAQWKSKTHAMPAFVILCRMAHMPEDKITQLTTANDFGGRVIKVAEQIR